MKREDFIAAARSLIGTPFRHQGRLPGIALDCVGVPICAAMACGIKLNDKKSYPDVPNGKDFVHAVEQSCDKINLDIAQIGDLMIFAWTKNPQHIAIISNMNPMRIIHSWSGAGGVVEHGIDKMWMRRFRGCYRLKAIQ